MESSGSNYIDTGFVPTSNTRVLIDYQFLEEPTTFGAVYGSRKTSSYQYWMYWRYSANSWSFRYTVSNTENQIAIDVLSRIEAETNKNVFTIGDKSVSATTSDFTGTYPMYLCALNNGGEVQYASKMRLYSCKIWEDGVLVRNYIPCKDSDNYIGLYDIVNHTFNMLLGSTENKASISYYADSLNFDATEYEYYLNFAYKPTSNIRVRLRYNDYTFGSDTVVTYKYITTSSQRITIGYSSLVSDTLGNQGWDGEGDFEIISLYPIVDNNYKYTF